MWLQALLTVEDFTQALEQLTPIRLPLDKNSEDRYLWLGRPREVSLVNGRGLRIVTHALLQWDVIGIRVPLTLRTVTVLLVPSVAQVDKEDALTFSVLIEDADLTAVPSFIEEPLIARVNEALDRPEARLAWHFLRTLDFRFELPAGIGPHKQLNLFARWGAVRVAEDAMTLAVSWGLNVTARGPQLEVPAQMREADEETAPVVPPTRVQSRV